MCHTPSASRFFPPSIFSLPSLGVGLKPFCMEMRVGRRLRRRSRPFNCAMTAARKDPTPIPPTRLNKIIVNMQLVVGTQTEAISDGELILKTVKHQQRRQIWSPPVPVFKIPLPFIARGMQPEERIQSRPQQKGRLRFSATALPSESQRATILNHLEAGNPA